MMSLPNQVVFIQFHPVVYMVKLNIEMSMASLISKLAKDKTTGFAFNSNSHTDYGRSGNRSRPGMGTELQSFHQVGIQSVPQDKGAESALNNGYGIHRRTDVEVRIENEDSDERRADGSSERTYRVDDEEGLTSNAK
ncbi:hypothetical protein IMZ48_47115 [Candidatus Bathyarchaeota archaeon]|nr:hypothetical protein [Candidatus Bathyarchaeota archaeon]